MSRQLINEYRADLDRLRQVSGSRRESVLREAFKDLLKRWGRSQDLQFIPEHDIVTPQKNRIYVDGALLHALRVPFGYWEAKDEDDDLDAEILAKRRKGYPTDNIIFSDDHTAVLIQDGGEVARVAMDDTDALYDLLTRFFAHERQEVADFNKAVKQFAADLPEILKALRERIAEKRAASRDFVAAERAFLKHAREAINPAVSEDDVQEMLIQHILTEDIFAKVFDNPDFHEQNNVAAELKKLEDALFGRGEKSTLLRALAPYYSGIASTAALISSHSEKQGFLKALYEDFYKAYNRKAADRLGVVYTPGEIVRFMIRSADWLCEKHFGKNLIDRGVEILDPATGTGTFIVELLEHFRGHHDKLRHKYKEELHANEVAILPYYVANLNIEATYQAITGQFAEYANLCLVDTLDNVDALGIHAGHQFDLLGSLSDENIERIKRQNRRKISVIIGNPPYNANQQNENDNNKNRAYAHIDRRIKETYIKASTAQKTKLYDMYVRFFRWASDRIGDEGIVAFITNRSFIDAHTADGFRRVAAKDFSEGWVVDLGGDYKKQGVGGSGNVFGIGTGVAISFWIKRRAKGGPARLSYLTAPSGSAEDKLSWLSAQPLSAFNWQLLEHRNDAAWVDIPDAEMSGLIPLIDKKNKLTEGSRDRAIFKLFSLGVATNRDDWVYDRNPLTLARKVRLFAATFNAEHRRWRREGMPGNTGDWVNRSIKWTSELEAHLRQPKTLRSARKFKRCALYRPFTKIATHFAPVISHRPYQQHRFFPFGTATPNPYLAMTGPGSQKPWMTLAADVLPDLHLVGAGAGTNVLPRYRYTKSGERVDNITDWAVRQFKDRYVKNAGGGGKLRAKLPRTRSSITSTPCSTIRCTARPMR